MERAGPGGSLSSGTKSTGPGCACSQISTPRSERPCGRGNRAGQSPERPATRAAWPTIYLTPLVFIQQVPPRRPATAAPWPTQPSGEDAIGSNREMKKAEFRSVPVLWVAGALPRLLSHSAKRMSPSVHAGVLAGTALSCPTMSRLSLPGMLFWSYNSLSSLFLIDSGADGASLTRTCLDRQMSPPKSFRQPGQFWIWTEDPSPWLRTALCSFPLSFPAVIGSRFINTSSLLPRPGRFLVLPGCRDTTHISTRCVTLRAW